MLKNSHLFQEIHQQPDTLSRLLANEDAHIRQLAAIIQERHISHIIIAARGTSDNAGRYAKYLLGAINGIIVTLATPSLFTIYKRPPQFGNVLVLGISQSGKSPDIVAVLAEARRQGVLTAVITNTPNSDLAQTSDHVINLHAGNEQAVAATKTYSSELLAIAMLSAALTTDSQMMTSLQQLPEQVQHTLAMNEPIAHMAQRYRYMQTCVVIGRGYNYATAFELALKLKELTYSNAEPYSSADFLHGPLALIDSGFPVVIIAPSGVMLPEIKQFTHSLKQQGAEIIAISDNSKMLELAQIPLTLPATVPEWASPITTIVPGQLFAMHLAHVRNYNVDQPRSIHKVTETL